jgi:hypothetical protein
MCVPDLPSVDLRKRSYYFVEEVRMAQLSSRSVLARALVMVPIVAIVACSDGLGPSASSLVSLSFTAAPATSGVNRFLVSDSTALPPAGETVTLSKVQLVLSHIELAQVDSACAAADSVADDKDEPERHDDCREINLAPVLVDVPLATSAQTAIAANVPPGKYRNLHARIDAFSADSRRKGAAEFLAAHPDFAGTSIRIEGTYGSKPFVYTTDTRAQIFVPFAPPLDVTANAKPNITVAVDPSGWFKTANGTTIDPTTAGKDQPNNRYIAANIRRSFRAFRDDDHDGHGDHESEGRD